MTRFVFSVNDHWQEKDFEEMIEKDICDYRVNAIRLKNEEILRCVNIIRYLSQEYKSNTRIFFDTPGAKARLWYSDSEKKTIAANSIFEIDLVTVPKKNTGIQLTGDELFAGACIGDILQIHRSGYISMSFQVIHKDNRKMHALAKTDILIGWGYHAINVDNYKIFSGISNADKCYISWINVIKPDVVGLSFADSVQIIEDMRKNLCESKYEIYAKIETRYAVEKIKELLVCSNGIIIGRDDLLSWYSQDEIDCLVVYIIELCKKSQVPVIPASNYFLSIGHGKSMSSFEKKSLQVVLSLEPEYVYVNETSKNEKWIDFYNAISNFYKTP